MTYNELFIKHSKNSRIPYSKLLQTQEWKIKRETILERDSHRCSKCKKCSTKEINYQNVWTGELEKEYENYFTTDSTLSDFLKFSAEEIFKKSDKPYFMQVHHKFYILNSLPWQYSEDALITLCNWCHLELH